MEYKGYDPDNPDIQNIQNAGNILKKILIILGVILAIYLFSTIFVQLNTKTNKVEPQPTRTTGQDWTVIKSTNIYYSPSFDSDTKGELAVGDIITLPEGVISLECKTISESGLS
jgi:hypothetical protein